MPCYDGISVDCHSVLSSRFSSIKAIGRSSNGFVLSAVDRTDGKQNKVALKRLSLKRKSHCRVALRELRILKRMDHENIVKKFNIRAPNGCEVNEFDCEILKDLDYVYLVEELLDTDLHNIIDRTGKLPEKIAKLFLYQMLRGLKYIHSANIIHRDIKPGNLFLNVEDLTMKIGDFGLGRIVDPKFDHAGHLTELVTTRYYRAPEIIQSRGKYDSSVDIWSSGCVFAEMCTGNVLFPGENDLRQLECIQSWFPADGNTLGRFQAQKLTGFSQAGLDILQKMLRFDPSKRPTASQLLQDPYFGDISDSADEPICPFSRVFHIEDEVDDLSIESLRNMIAKECHCESSDFNSDIFQGFDADFETEPKDSEKVTREDSYLQCSYEGDNNKGSDISENSSSGIEADLCPSLSNIISASFVDEPYRDPGCCEARTSDCAYSFQSMKVDSQSTEHCSANFPKASTMLDLSRCVMAAPSDCKRFSDLSCPVVSFQKIPKNIFHHKGLEKEILNIDKFSGRGLDTRRSCRVSDFSVSEHLRRNKFHTHSNHWDAIRIWI